MTALRRRLRSGTVVAAVAMWFIAAVLGATTAFAGHYVYYGWVDEHRNYPPRPSGSTALNNVFGPACSGNANYNRNVTWQGRVSSGGVGTYTPGYHKKLGGGTTAGFYSNTGGRSSNMEDVNGHLGNDHKLYGDEGVVKGGIWGYNCRTISGTSRYSVHSWGAAIDINASYEQYPDPDCQPNSFGSGVSAKWENHNWYWGKYFGTGSCDPMHFQYVTNY